MCICVCVCVCVRAHHNSGKVDLSRINLQLNEVLYISLHNISNFNPCEFAVTLYTALNTAVFVLHFFLFVLKDCSVT